MKTQIKYTRPILPSLEELTSLLRPSWETGVVTNGGPLSQRLERELETICQVKHAILCTNGTMALFNAIQSATSKKVK